MGNVAMQGLSYDHFYPLLNMAHAHGKNENYWLDEFMLISIKMMAINIEHVKEFTIKQEYKQCHSNS